MSDSQLDPTQLFLLPKFGDRFLDDHAGSIIGDPEIAIVEIVANSSDAGADKVEITWFPNDTNRIEISDNGVGMSKDEFERRWLELNYNRRQLQGGKVVFPHDNAPSNRKVFGKNGKGRHGMFCFAPLYFVATAKDGVLSTFKISRAEGQSKTPFEVVHLSQQSVDISQHGTRIWAESLDKPLDEQALVHLLGSKFIADPSFRIFINKLEVELTELPDVGKETIIIDGLGSVDILLVDTDQASRTSKQHGVAWWVNNRLVGQAGWVKLNGEHYIDARTTNAKRYTFIVIADILQDCVFEDWTSFHKNNANVKKVAEPVESYIEGKLRELFKNINKDRKASAIKSNYEDLLDIPPSRRSQIGKFLDDIQSRCPTINPSHLSDMVAVLANLEKSRSTYALLHQLAKLNPNDLDGLHDILNKWSVAEMRVILDELYARLELIKRLEEATENPQSDELHDIQPLFERGLWIFGPEFESVEYTSNKSLKTVIEQLWGKDAKAKKIANPRKRPDFVVLSDSTLDIYACDRFDKQNEVEGVGRVLIIELKRGGLELTAIERTQGESYAGSLRESGKVEYGIPIVVYVLGTTKKPGLSGATLDDGTIIHATTYSEILRKAHARTFNLIKKLKQVTSSNELVDKEVEQILSERAKQDVLGI